MLPDMEKLRRAVEKRLTAGRYAHSLAVCRRAMELAGRWGADWYAAGVAGLVHDVCKDMSRAAQLNYLRACGIIPDNLTMGNPAVWHAAAGAEYARRELGVRDEAILDAVRYHTTGRRAMSRLEQVVYVADLTSADRAYPDVARMRELSEQSLEAAVFYAVRHAVRTLSAAELPLTRETWEAYNYYLPYYTENLS